MIYIINPKCMITKLEEKFQNYNCQVLVPLPYRFERKKQKKKKNIPFERIDGTLGNFTIFKTLQAHTTTQHLHTKWPYFQTLHNVSQTSPSLHAHHQPFAFIACLKLSSLPIIHQLVLHISLHLQARRITLPLSEPGHLPWSQFSLVRLGPDLHVNMNIFIKQWQFAVRVFDFNPNHRLCV